MPSRICCSVGVGLSLQQVDRRHDHARRAVAALQAVLLPEAFLQRMQLRRPCASPSIVVTVEPSAWTAKTVQDLALRPSMSTVQAPHWLVSQPTCVPVRLRCSRRKWTRSRRGSTSRLAHLAVDGHRDLGHKGAILVPTTASGYWLLGYWVQRGAEMLTPCMTRAR